MKATYLKRELSRNTFITIEDIEFDVNITFEYQPAIPGVFDLAPENCYPSEPAEIEVGDISHLIEDQWMDLTFLMTNVDFADIIETRLFELMEDE